MIKRLLLQLLAGLLATGVMQIAASSKADERVLVSGEITPRQYTFSWMFADSDSMKPRGGTTSGPKVQLDSRTSAAFAGLQVPDLDARERDRRAILAMGVGTIVAAILRLRGSGGVPPRQGKWRQLSGPDFR